MHGPWEVIPDASSPPPLLRQGQEARRALPVGHRAAQPRTHPLRDATQQPRRADPTHNRVCPFNRRLRGPPLRSRPPPAPQTGQACTGSLHISVQRHVACVCWGLSCSSVRHFAAPGPKGTDEAVHGAGALAAHLLSGTRARMHTALRCAHARAAPPPVMIASSMGLQSGVGNRGEKGRGCEAWQQRR